MTFYMYADTADSSSQADYNLTTLEAVREFLQKKSGVTIDQDPLVESLITRASVLIQNLIDRQFVSTSGTRSVAYSGAGFVDIGDARSVSAVTYDSDGGSPTTLVDDRWFLRPASKPNGVYQALWLPDFRRDRFGCSWTDRVVTVTGEWGFAEVPADVEHACIVTVRDWLKSDVAFNPDGGVDRLGGDTIAPRILAGLDHYRLPTV